MKTCECSRETSATRLGFVTYIEKDETKKTLKILGAIEAARCEKCLLKDMWVQTILLFIFFIINVMMIAVSLTALRDTLGTFLALVWTGSLIVNIISMVRMPKRVVCFSALNKKRSNYRVLNRFPEEDFIWLSADGEVFLKDQALQNRYRPKLNVFTVEQMRTIFENTTEEGSEKEAIKVALEEGIRRASEDALKEPATMTKRFLKGPLAVILYLGAGFFLIGSFAIFEQTTIATDIFYNTNVFIRSAVGILCLVFAGLYLALLILMMKKNKKKFVFFAAAAGTICAVLNGIETALMMDSDSALGVALPITLLLLVIALTSLLWLFYTEKKTALPSDNNHHPAAQTDAPAEMKEGE